MINVYQRQHFDSASQQNRNTRDTETVGGSICNSGQGDIMGGNLLFKLRYIFVALRGIASGWWLELSDVWEVNSGIAKI